MLSASHLFVLSVPKPPAGFHLILVGSLIHMPRTGTVTLECWSSIHTWASWTPFLQDCGLSSHGPDTPFPRTCKTSHGGTERSLQFMASPLLSSLLPVIHYLSKVALHLFPIQDLRHPLSLSQQDHRGAGDGTTHSWHSPELPGSLLSRQNLMKV